MKEKYKGVLVCLAIALPSWILGKVFPVIGGAVIAILAGMFLTLIWKDKKDASAGIKWTSKVILQTAVVLLGFGMNLGGDFSNWETISSHYTLYDYNFFSDWMAFTQGFKGAS